MKYNPEIHHRRSIRLKGYDYSQPGAYFITICTYQRQCWFGEIRDAQMQFNQIGKIVLQEWLRSAQIRPNFKLDESIVMPNHLPGIVWIIKSEVGNKFDNKDVGNLDGYNEGVCNEGVCNEGVCNEGVCNTPLRGKLERRGNSLSSFIGGFKAAVTRQINQWRHNNSIPIWQRNYYESIIRDEDGLNQIREYIRNNPKAWDEDTDNPQHHSEFQEYDLDLIF